MMDLQFDEIEEAEILDPDVNRRNLEVAVSVGIAVVIVVALT